MFVFSPPASNYVTNCSFSEIRELYETPSMQDLQPISGYLTFDEGATQRDIVIESIDDTEEENDEVFSVRLTSSRGGARVDDFYYSAILTGKVE